ncbi:MAG: citrate synthase [SAR324 cluster bacterium]|nr:citrate synthase [SAR324 cluster bacterium]
MSENVKITFPEGKTIEFPVVTGSENEKAIDIAKLRSSTGYITLDPGYMNTGACVSSITYLDGETGILRYRGIPIEQLAENSTFTEVSYLLIYGELPNQTELKRFSSGLTAHSMIHEDMINFFESFSVQPHPMATLSAMVCSLSAYYSEASGTVDMHEFDRNVTRLLAKIRTIAAFSYKKSIGQPFVYPKDSLAYCANFLRMMFAVPAEEYELDQDIVNALDLLLILHADHEQNCSASTVRGVGSSHANIYASIASGILALWGPLHGGANQQVMFMLEKIHANGGNVDTFMEQVKDKNSNARLMGFGHRVYKNYDPRAKIVKQACDRILNKLGIKDPLLDIAMKLEERALAEDYFIERKLYPNVDFYSGIIYRAIGIPSNMFTVMFALGRIPGWIAQWKEMHDDPATKIMRPRQIYSGPTVHDYVPMKDRV